MFLLNFGKSSFRLECWGFRGKQKGEKEFVVQREWENSARYWCRQCFLCKGPTSNENKIEEIKLMRREARRIVTKLFVALYVGVHVVAVVSGWWCGGFVSTMWEENGGNSRSNILQVGFFSFLSY